MSLAVHPCAATFDILGFPPHKSLFIFRPDVAQLSRLWFISGPERTVLSNDPSWCQHGPVQHYFLEGFSGRVIISPGVIINRSG
ncbi:hypothetical protein GDO81_020987 [Engystomops pustulosus]|uniref:Uncharacterized protein n=1 Tax=Engystomops pustulosus TaxID=76066 RepID=A0AAV6ZPX4_ENGPU|nr:hypothetical protein GDO81_020987 [Engystomops pustulosus]